MKKILITGAGGYIGSVASYVFLQKGYSIVALDSLQRGYRAPIEFLKDKFGRGKVVFYKKNLVGDTLIDVFNNEPEIEAVIHFAAFCSVDESTKFPELYFKNNVYGSLRLFEAMEKCKVKKIVFSSTCCVYGEPKYIPVDEEHPICADNPYGESKIMVENMLKWFGKLKGFSYIILRYFNVCGASDDGEIGDSKRPSTLLMQNAVRGALGIEPFFLTCSKVDTQDGSPIRDYINVVDLAEAHVCALEKLISYGKNNIINLGTGKGNSVLEIVNTVQRVTGKTFPLRKTTPRQGEAVRIYADIKKAKKVLGWVPKRTLEDSVNSLIKWYTKHPNGWEK